ncbi:1-phosphofructokinase [Carboxydocella sporoproducens DSM 16521]|uniref:Tagatose-6-phosphate kinase n=2 Tax=Carboxydocella TaxID=178898 RepID=A0A1T4Q6M1_9FIRM|nr:MULTISPECIES: 1-phosphofructokinase [Carboxydocella]AVX21189.1 fructose-1-phosphate kinase [Carboxydocella thermautotrophica]AVX31624.1 fructose-1-phosphate kinase [Carboxydocella thermautotrophica]SJZ99349.1 1-phosphofructokinase [Carboxydocella sporoproducens DSM 16521]
MNSAAVVTVTLNPALDKTVTVEGFTAGSLNRVQEVRLDPGGKGVNVARVLKNFGVSVLATGFIAGMQGKLLLKALEDEGITTAFVSVPGETRTNLKVVDLATRQTTEINEPGFVVDSARMQTFYQLLDSVLEQTAYLILGGSLPQGAAADTYRELISRAKAKGVKVVLDADGEALRAGLAAQPFAVKPNLAELENLLGRSLQDTEAIIAAGSQLLEQGVELAVISRGSKGAVVLNREEVIVTEPFPIVPQSTVGAGDTMVAALVYALLQQKPLAETAAWATAAGTIAASKAGTQVCTREEVEANLARVKVINWR